MNGHCGSKLLQSGAHPQQKVHALHGQINNTLLRGLFSFCCRPVREPDAKEFHKDKKVMMKLHTLIRCRILTTMESCRLFLLKFKVLGYKKFPTLSPYLDWEEERCTLFLCLLFHFYKELCALNRYKTFFFFFILIGSSNWRLSIAD